MFLSQRKEPRRGEVSFDAAAEVFCELTNGALASEGVTMEACDRIDDPGLSTKSTLRPEDLTGGRVEIRCRREATSSSAIRVGLSGRLGIALGGSSTSDGREANSASATGGGGFHPTLPSLKRPGRRVVARALPDDERSSSASRRPLSLHCPDLGRRSDGPPVEAPATPEVEAPPPGAEGGWVLPARNVNGFGFSAVGRKRARLMRESRSDDELSAVRNDVSPELAASASPRRGRINKTQTRIVAGGGPKATLPHAQNRIKARGKHRRSSLHLRQHGIRTRRDEARWWEREKNFCSAACRHRLALLSLSL